MANTKQTKIRRSATRRKFRYPYLKTSDEADFIDSIEDGRYGYYPTELETTSSMDSQSSIDTQHQQNFERESLLEQCSITTGPHELLLSDHTASIDVLILEREMKTVLTDLERLGIVEDDYKSLALTTTEEEKVDESVHTWPPIAFHGEENKAIDRYKNSSVAERENDWEVLSSAGSVWTVETFEDDKSYRDAFLDSNVPLTSVAGSSAHFNGEPKIHTVPVEMMSPVYKTSFYPPKQVVNLEMLERADLWSSIRDSIKGFGKR